MLSVKEIFNNNVVLVRIDHKRLAIITGSGVGFGKRQGDRILTDKVQKIFYLDTETSRRNLYILLKDIPIDVVTTTYEIIDMAKQKYHVQVLDYIYITLSDHINGVYKRFKNHQYQESMVPNFLDQYPVEYKIATEALQIMRHNLGVQLPDSEVRNLALHFINAYGQSTGDSVFGKGNDTQTLTDIVQGILAKHGVMKTVVNQNYYDRFIIHLQFLMDRIDNLDFDNNKILPGFETDLKQGYPRSYALASEMFTEIRKQLFSELKENERIYFVIHIQRLINEQPQKL